MPSNSWIICHVSVFISAAVGIVLVIYGYFFHNRSLINPISAIIGLGLILFGLFSAFAAGHANNEPQGQEQSLFHIVWINLFFISSTCLAYFLSANNLSRIFARTLGGIAIKKPSLYCRLFSATALLLGAVISLFILVNSNAEGFLWISAPRQAYLQHRSGVGQWWLLYQACIVTCFFQALSAILDRRFNFYHLVIACALAMFALYFSGSKAAILTPLCVSFLFYHFYVRRISLFPIVFFAFFILLCFQLLLPASIEGSSSLSLAGYFSEYVAISSLVVEAIQASGYAWGKASISSLWYFVPRSLFGDKPFEYGATLFHSQLFPGSAELGATPGVLSWITAYMDAGLLGVILYALTLGVITRTIYVNFQRSKDIGSFLLMVTTCFIPILASSSALFYLPMTIFLWVSCGKNGASGTTVNRSE